MRASMTNVTLQAGRIGKQNSQSEIYQLDPKIIELKKKYQLQNKGQPTNTFSGHRHTSSLRQQQVLRKLENIKSELQLIPDWQNYARSILFDGKNQLDIRKSEFLAPQYSKSSIRLSNKYIPESTSIRQQSQTFQESRALNNSNISFKINHTVSIEKPCQKTDYTYKDKYNVTPVKASTQFKKNIEYENFTNNKKYLKQKTNNGVDDKINQISRKIRESQMKKKTLGVDFVPFEDKSGNKKGQSPKYYNEQNYRGRVPENMNQKNCSSIQKIYSRPPRPASSTVSNFYDGMNKSIITKDQMKQSSISPRFAQSQHQQFSLSGYNKKTRSNSVHQNYDNKPKVPNYLEQRRYEQQMLEVSKNNKMLHQAQNALKERKKKVEVVEQKKRSKEQTKKLVQAFCEQVKLDQKYRNCKLWFKAYKNQKKINRLKSLLELEGVKLSEQKINLEFEVQQKEDNPFFSVSSQQCDVQQVANSYIECEKYWKKHLYKRFSRQALEAEGFSNLSVDLDKKGYLVLEDLVRFLNMETGTFFRNRDLFTIFKRMSNNSGRVSFKDFIYTFYA